MHPRKLEQRRQLLRRLRRRGTVVELFGGKGNLSRHAYGRRARTIILVDKDTRSLRQADRKLDGVVRHEVHPSDNIKWIRREAGGLEDVVLVDFDAFGSPADAVKAFFKRFRVEKPILVGLTDGSARYTGYRQDDRGRRWIRRKYLVNIKPDGTREGQLRILDRFMEELGRRRGFTARRVNFAHGEGKVVYVGYRLSPQIK
ncbi:MAG: hypothetical protein ACE5Z5_14015 [Candidatus Bathyarchaeia archaeon]